MFCCLAVDGLIRFSWHDLQVLRHLLFAHKLQPGASALLAQVLGACGGVATRCFRIFKQEFVQWQHVRSPTRWSDGVAVEFRFDALNRCRLDVDGRT